MDASFKRDFFNKLFLEVGFLVLLSLLFFAFVSDYWICAIASLSIFLLWHYYMGLKLVTAIFKRKTVGGISFGVWALVFDEYNYLYFRKKGDQVELLHLIANFKKALNKVKQGMLVCNLNHTIYWSNKSAGRILQINYKSKAKQNLLHLQHDLNFRNYVEELALNKKNKSTLVIQKSQNHYKIQGYRLENSYMLLIENITQAEVSKLRQSRILSYINHDLRTPLTVMSGYLEMLEEEPSLLNKVLEPIRTQSSKIKHLIEELSELASLSEDKEVSNNWCNFSLMVETIAKDVQGLYPDYPLSLTVKSGVYIKGDDLTLNRLVTNLVYNAIKHNPKGTPIEIKLEEHKEGIRFGVKDKGIGIDSEHLPYLTVRFYRADKARGTSGNQNGLGLAIVKHILESYGSKVEIESSKFIGSEFYFHIKKKYTNFADQPKQNLP